MTTWEMTRTLTAPLPNNAGHLMTDELVGEIVAPELSAAGTERNTAAGCEAISQLRVKINRHAGTQEGVASVSAI